jgi:hypothetical protein
MARTAHYPVFGVPVEDAMPLRRAAPCRSGSILQRAGRGAMLSAIAVFVAAAAAAQGDADKTFRKWADDSVKVLRESGSADSRAKAAEYLGGFGYPNAIEALQAALRDPDAKVRAAAAGALWKTGEPARPARAALAGALDDADPAVAIRAAGALETLGMSPADLAGRCSRWCARPRASELHRGVRHAGSGAAHPSGRDVRHLVDHRRVVATR